MQTFRALFKFELKRFLKKQYLVIVALLMVFALAATQYGIFQYKNMQEQKEDFLAFEKAKVENFFSYRVYGTYGFRMTTFPDPFVIFSMNSIPFNDMVTQIDTSERLPIYNLLQADNAFKIKKKWFTDFSGVILFFATFLALLFGLDTFHNIEYIKILSSISGHTRVFINIILARAMLLFLVLLSALILAYLLILVNGISLPLSWGLPVFLLVIVLNVCFFFALGTAVGTIRSKRTGLLIGIFLWFIFIFIVPTVVDTIVELKSNSITSAYKMELQKLKIFNGFQNQLRKNLRIFNLGDKPTNEEIEEIRKFLNNEFKSVQAIDEKIISQMESNTSLFSWISRFFPTSNYQSTFYELTGNGYEGLLKFYKFSKYIKLEFIKNFFEIVYFSGKSEEKVESFLKNNRNLYQLQMRIPASLTLGVILSLLYTIVLLTLAHRGYKKSLFYLPTKEDYQFEGQSLHLEKSGFKSSYIINDLFGRQMFNLLSGREAEIRAKGYDYKIEYSAESPVPGNKKSKFLYLQHMNKLPGHFVAGDFLSLLSDLLRTGKKRREEIISKHGLTPLWKKRFHQLNDRQRGDVLMAILEAGEFPVYLIDDVIDKMPVDFIIQLKNYLEEQVEEKDALIIFLTNWDFQKKKEHKNGQYFNLSENWEDIVDSIELVRGGGGDRKS